MPDQVPIATKFGPKIVNGKMAGMNDRPEHIREVYDTSEQPSVGVTDLFKLLIESDLIVRIKIAGFVG